MTPRLEGDLVVLEPLAARHERELFDASRDPEIWRWLLGAVPDREQFARWIADSVAESTAGREGAFATVERASGRVLGTSRYLALRPEHRGLEIGWTWLTPATWRTGANLETKLLMLAHAFDSLGCRRVEFKTDARNQRSRAALAGLPAQFEGIFRRHMVTPYGVRDSAYYSVIDEEWPAVRENLHRRLQRAQSPAAGAAP